MAAVAVGVAVGAAIYVISGDGIEINHQLKVEPRRPVKKALEPAKPAPPPAKTPEPPEDLNWDGETMKKLD